MAGCASILGPALDIDSLSRESGVELESVTHHPQDDFHCGPASLLSMLEHAGVDTDFETVTQRVYIPEREGSLQVEMQATVRSFGRVAYRLPPEPEAVIAELEAGRPVLILQNLAIPERPLWHYAVVVGFDARENHFILRSGDQPRLQEPARRWLRQWEWAGRWALVTLPPGELPARPDPDRLAQALADFESTAAAEDAETAWQAGLDVLNERSIAWLGLGNSRYRQGRWSDAAEAYDQALKLDREHLPARLNLARTLDRQGRPCQGLEVLEAAEPEPDHPMLEKRRELHGELRTACDEAS